MVGGNDFLVSLLPSLMSFMVEILILDFEFLFRSAEFDGLSLLDFGFGILFAICRWCRFRIVCISCFQKSETW